MTSAYTCSSATTSNEIEEVPCEKYFPEFVDISGRVIWMSVQNCDSFKRLSAAGCDNGYLRVTVTDVLNIQVLKTWSLSMDGPISSLHLFTLTAEKEVIFTQSPCKVRVSTVRVLFFVRKLTSNCLVLDG